MTRTRDDVADGGDDDAFDDLPETHLGDEAYEDFVASELDEDGAVRGDPPVGRWILLVVVLVLAAMVIAFR